jgi:hypothetical protein
MKETATEERKGIALSRTIATLLRAIRGGTLDCSVCQRHPAARVRQIGVDARGLCARCADDAALARRWQSTLEAHERLRKR